MLKREEFVLALHYNVNVVTHPLVPSREGRFWGPSFVDLFYDIMWIVLSLKYLKTQQKPRTLIFPIINKHRTPEICSREGIFGGFLF
jgi:hypothetical protein